MNKKLFIFSLLVFIFALGVRIFFITQKQGYHVDEMFTRETIIGHRVIGDSFLVDNNKLISGKRIKDFYFDYPNMSLSMDLKNLRQDNYSDNAHPSLYYSLVRLGFVGNLIDNYKAFGCGLNLIMFIFSFFIMRKILIRLFGDNKLVPIGLAIAFLNTGTISTTLFIRPYEMQMLSFLCVSYVYLILLDKIESNESIYSLKYLLLSVSSISFVFLSGYFPAVYVFILGLILLWASRKNPKNLLFLVLCAITSIAVTWFVFRGYFQLINSQRFLNVTFAGSNFNLQDFLFKFILYISNLNKFLFYILIVIVAFVSLFFLDKTKIKRVSLPVSALLWTCLAAIFAPFPILRYIVPAFPIMSIFLVYLIQKISKDKQNIFSLLIVSIYILSAMFPLKNESIDTNILYKKHSLYLPLAGRIENLYEAQMPKLNKKYPVVILSQFWYKPLYLVSRLDDEQMYQITFIYDDVIYDLDNIPYKKYYLFLDKEATRVRFNKEKYKISLISDFLCYRSYMILVKD